jgi:hypothetical protein
MTRFYSGRHWLSSTSTSGGIAAPLPDAQIGSPHTPLQGFQPLVCYGQKTFTFHLDFGSEIVQNARYGMLALHSMENLELANAIPGRVKGK